MKKITVFAAAVLPLLMLGATAAYAGWGKRSDGPNLERAQRFIKWRVNDVLDEIDATERQTDEINRVVDGLISDALPMIEEHKRTKGEFRELFFSESPDAEAVHAAIDERIAKFSSLAHKAADAALEVHETLTPEQRGELQEMLPDRR
ncbi:MAG: Spy/CpxP family protein refolding chaperone [Myxococcota bacterium]